MQWVAAGRRHLTAVAVAVVLVLLLIHFSGRGSLAAGRTHASDASVPPPAQQTDVETPPPQRPRKGKCPMVLTGVAKEARASKCAWWQAAHAHFMAEIQVGFCNTLNCQHVAPNRFVMLCTAVISGTHRQTSGSLCRQPSSDAKATK